MKLNAEQVKNEIQSLIKALKECGGWVKRGNGEGWFNHEILADALALITSQEQKIFELENRLKECENGYEGTLHLERAKIEKLTEERDTFRECAYNLQNYVNGIFQKQSQGYEPSAAKAAAEMEMWRIVALEKRRLTDENERLHASCTELTRNLHECKADTVRKMQSAIKEYYSKSCYRPTKEHPVKHTQIEHLFYIVDQIAKELLEGVCDTTN